MICDFLYHRSLKEFVKNDVYVRFGEMHLLLPFHIQELQLQELFLINEGRTLYFLQGSIKIVFLLFLESYNRARMHAKQDESFQAKNGRKEKNEINF